jgi:hypothetical protein
MKISIPTSKTLHHSSLGSFRLQGKTSLDKLEAIKDNHSIT